MRAFQVGDLVTWPARIASTATALLGIRGAGKSNLARVIAEEAYRSKIPVVVFDPVGNWYGIRAGKDGKPDGGLPFAIFGGRHGDVPLEAGAGQLIADTVIDTRLSCVIDMSHEDFSEGDKCRFLTAFGDRLFRRKQPETGWILLVLEEADDYAPQARGGGGVKGPAAATLGVFQKLVKRARSKGLGALLISQRSAALNKDLLNMAETLVAFRTTAPHDQDAIEGWIKHHSLSAEAMKTISGLADGEAWVWSPDALGTFKRTKFRRMDTLDTGRTPEHVVGKAAVQPTLADVDLPGLRKKMADTIERAKADDPRELRRQLAEAKTEIARKPLMLRPGKIVEKPVLKDREIKRIEVSVDRLREGMAFFLKRTGEMLHTLGNRQQVVLLEAEAIKEGLKKVGIAPPTSPARPSGAYHPAPPRSTARAPVAARQSSGDRLPAAQQRILDALAWLAGVGVTSPDKTQVSLFANLAPEAGYTGNQYGALRTAGLIDYPSAGTARLTKTGYEKADSSRVPSSAKEMQAQVLAKLPKAQRAILEVLIGAYPEALTKHDTSVAASLAPEAGYTGNQYGRLRSMGLIDYPTPGTVVARSVLFLEGAR